MRRGGSSAEIGRAAYDEAYPRVSDALTLYLWRRPAFLVARWAAANGVPAGAAALAEASLASLTFLLFWRGHYWLGIAVAAGVTLLSVVALVLSRLEHQRRWANRLRVALEVAVPLFWWWAWAHGLPAYGRPLEPIYATMVLWVVDGGTVAIRVIERLALHRFNGMEVHRWRPLDTKFRLVSASRNTNLVILALALLFGRPDTGLVLIAWWVLISLIIHAVRLAQLTELQSRRQKIASWLDQ